MNPVSDLKLIDGILFLHTIFSWEYLMFEAILSNDRLGLSNLKHDF